MKLLSVKNLFLSLLLSVGAQTAIAQVSFIKEMGSAGGMTTVNISTTVLQLKGTMSEDNSLPDSILDKIENIQLLKLTHDATRQMMGKFNGLLARHHFAEMLEINKEGTHSVIYKSEYSSGLTQLVLVKQNNSRTDITVLTGRLTLQDIQQLKAFKEQ